MMNKPVLPNFDAIAIGDEVAALEREAQSKLADAKGEFASRSEKIAAILWKVKQDHPEHLDAICKRAGIGRSRRKELLQIGSGRKTVKQSRQTTAARQAKFKAKKKANAAESPDVRGRYQGPGNGLEGRQAEAGPESMVNVESAGAAGLRHCSRMERYRRYHQRARAEAAFRYPEAGLERGDPG
jgi:hypothetical protein